MGKVNWHPIRIVFWWSAALSCVIALLINSSLPARAIITASALLSTALTAAFWEHGWFKAPTQIGQIPRAILLLCLIWIAVVCLARFVWPPDSFVYLKPGVVLNPDTSNEVWMFFPVVRGPQTLFNVSIAVDDRIKREQFRHDLNSAKSEEERRQLVSEEAKLPLTIHYDELDSSTVAGADRESRPFVLATEQRKRLDYDIRISFRGGDVHEVLRMNSPEDHKDWQYKMNVVWNGNNVIDCQDPRFPKDESKTDKELSQCFPEYQGRLPE
jgi:hypothetical protein